MTIHTADQRLYKMYTMVCSTRVATFLNDESIYYVYTVYTEYTVSDKQKLNIKR